mgnify:CR=1 FL=1
MTRVLLVDDDADLLRSFARLLRSHDFEPVTALGGQAGIEVIAEHGHGFDAILSDVQMPESPGPYVYAIAVAAGLRHRMAFMSGAWSASAAFATELDRAGVPRLDKPVPTGVLTETLTRIAEGR